MNWMGRELHVGISLGMNVFFGAKTVFPNSHVSISMQCHIAFLNTFGELFLQYLMLNEQLYKKNEI